MLFSLEILTIIILAILLWQTALTYLVVKVLSGYRKIHKNGKEIDWELLVKKSEKIDNLENCSRKYFQKIGIIRFNPFSETGGDQSFSIALLNNEGSGLVISSLHSRERTRIYAKSIEKGKAIGYDISKEEKEAVAKALVS